MANNRRLLELKVEMARRGTFPEEQGVQPASFDPAFESKRAQQVAGQAGGVNIESQREAMRIGKPRGGASQSFLNATREAVKEFDRRKAIAESGVELNTPLPASSAGVGFSADTAKAVQKILTDQFASDGLLEGQKAVVRRGPTSGALEFQDPKTKKFHLVNLDLMSKAGFALPAAGDIIGSIGGGIVGGGSTRSVPGALAGEAIGATAGTATGEMLRLAIGRSLGYNELSTGEILSSAGKQGAIAGGITLGTGGVIVGAKEFKNFLQGRKFSRKGALEAGFTSDQADAAVEEINNILAVTGSDKQFKPTVAQRAQSATGTDEINIGAAESTMRSKSDFAQEFVDRDAANQAALTDAFQGNQRALTEVPNQGSDAASAALESGVKKRVDQAKGIAYDNQRTLQSQLDSLDARFPQAAGKDVRPIIEAKREVAQAAIDDANDAWRGLTNYDEVTGLTGVQIPIDEGIAAMRVRLGRESKSAILPITKTSKSKLFGGEKGKSFDLADYNIALSDLKRSVRTASKSGNISDPAIGDMKLAIDAIQKARNKGLIQAGRGDVLEALLDAEAKRAAFGETFERSLVGKFLKLDGAGYKIDNEDIFGQILNAGGDDVDAVIRVVGDNPQAMNAVREGIVGQYNKAVLRNGIPDRKSHDLFMASNGEMLGKFFSPQEMRTIQGLGRMGEVVTKQGKQLERIIKTAESTWGRGKLTSLDPEKMLDFVFNDSSLIKLPSGNAIQVAIKKVRWLKSRLKDNPAAIAGLRSDYAKRVGDAVVKDGVIQPSALEKVLKDETVLREFMGGTYVDNLKTIRTGLVMANKKFARLSGDELASAMVQAVRGTDFAAPLSKRGRRFTALLLFAKRGNHKILKDALLNPEKLKDIAELVTHDAVTRRTVELASSLGMILPIQGGLEEQ